MRIELEYILGDESADTYVGVATAPFQ